MAMELKVKDKVYQVKFTYNSLCDTDLLDRVGELAKALQSGGAENDADVMAMGKIKELFSCVRDLLFVGFEKFNPAESKQEVGEILDDYHEEATEDDKRGILDLYAKLSEELTNEGFLGNLFEELNRAAENKAAKIPQDHKKKEK